MTEPGETMATDAVRVRVDDTVCVGIGQCEMLEPDVFFINDDAISTVVDGATLSAERAAVVIERCPSGAISIVADA
ncbi:MAG: ferredoxin [Acidimicrobiales bacterium]